MTGSFLKLNNNIPAVIYGDASPRAFLFLHGKSGCKEEGQIFARNIAELGYQVMAIDLPCHGERSDMKGGFDPWTAAPEIEEAIRFMLTRWQKVSLRANSIGAYFALQADISDMLERALFVSPILDMERLIGDMMGWAGVTAEMLRDRGEIETGFGETLSWRYLEYSRAHRENNWSVSTHILFSAGDNMTPRSEAEEFSRMIGAKLTVTESGEHWFHTPEQLSLVREWERKSLELINGASCKIF